jgi:hypothetical protein
MNRLLITGTDIEWTIQNIANSWLVEELYTSVKVVTGSVTYKIVSLDDSITYCEIPINNTVIKYNI